MVSNGKLYKADLHIHSCLSPCGDISMLPSVICEKQLDVISITDHNSARNVAVFISLCKDKIVVPGIEIHTVEDVHILGYFPELEHCLKVSKIVEENLPKFPYDPEKFGYQIVINENEEFVNTIDEYLGFPTNLTIEDAIEIILSNHGLPVFAHVDRKFGAIYQLGLLPEGTNVVEVKKRETYEELKKNGYIALTSSDAHLPDEVGVRKIFMEDKPKNSQEVIDMILERRFKTIWD